MKLTFALSFFSSLALFFSSLALAEPSPKPLAQLNALTQSLSGKETVAAEEVERLFEQGEVIAFRDATRGTTPQAITYAASTERALEAYALKGAGPARVLTELALTLAGFASPQGASQLERFHAMLISSMGVKPADARPMPELRGELTEIGQWAARTVEKMAPRLPAREAVLARLRLLIARGQYADAVALAGEHSELGARAQAWMAAALILKGDVKAASNPAALAMRAGGEAALIVRSARLRRARLQAAELTSDLAGDPQERCHKLFASPAGAGSAELALLCSTLLWDDPDRTWLGSAAQLVSSGPPGAPVRAANLLRVLFGAQRPDAAGRADLLSKYRRELDQLGNSADERRALWLLGNVGASEQPMQWVPSAPDEQKEMLALDRAAPCDAATFALRAMAVRGNPATLGSFAAQIAQHCLSEPGGAQVTVDALGVLLTLSHEPDGPLRPDAVEKLALALATAHPDDPSAIGAHADAVAAHALAGGGVDKAPLVALEAALARFEEAIQHTTPASGSAARARLDANAGFLSLALGTRLDAKKRAPFLMRAQRHLRFAIALSDNPAALATRARFDSLTGLHTSTLPSLDRTPPSPAKSRAACLLAAQATEAGQSAAARRYSNLARGGERSKLDSPELLLAPEASFNVTLDERGLHPAAAMRAELWLAPACNPDSMPAKRSTPKERKEAGR